jgi:hypothetical protein
MSMTKIAEYVTIIREEWAPARAAWTYFWVYLLVHAIWVLIW